MKNLLIALVIIVAGAGAYYLVQKSDTEGYRANGALEYIPADTAVFAGQLAPFPIKDYLHSFSYGEQQIAAPSLAELHSPQERFIVALYDQYLTLLKDPDALLAAFGLADHVESYFYTLGMIPVIKLQIANPEAFMGQLDLAEQKSGLQHSITQVGGYNYRSYPVSTGRHAINLLIGDHLGWMTVTLSYAGEDQQVLEQSLGLKAVENNMTQSKLLQDIVAQHGFLRESLGFVNHQTIATALTQGKGELGKQLTALFEMMGDKSFSGLRTPACEQELNAITANWPMTVMGMKNISITPEQSELQMQTIIDSKNTKMLAALQSLRGFINPAVEKFGGSVFSIGLGLNTDNIASAMSEIWRQLTQPKLQCAPLVEWQSQLTSANPGMLSMVSGMAQGAKGLSFVLSDYKLKANGEPKDVDALLSVPVEDPSKLWALASNFAPVLAGVELPADGSGVDLVKLLHIPYTGKVMVAQKGKHLVIYTGAESQKLADALIANKSIKANGMLSVFADYNKIFTPLASMAKMMGEELPAEFLDMTDTNIKVQFGMDVNDAGIVFNNRISSQSQAYFAK